MNFSVWMRALKAEDAGMVNKLRSDPDMENLVVGDKRFVSLAREVKWVSEISMSDNNNPIYMAICEKSRMEAVGYTSISDVDYRNGSCFWSGIKICPASSGRGLGFQAELLVLKYAFEELKMKRVSAKALERHEYAIRYMQKAGFRKEGLMRKCVFKNGEYQNIWMLSILEEEYKELRDKYGL